MTFVNVELPDEVAMALQRPASDRDSTPAAILAEMARNGVAARLELDRMIDESLADVAAGRTAFHEEVMAEMYLWAAELRAKEQNAQ